MANYKVDSNHSSIEFSIKHMMVSKVKGTFDTYDATVSAEDLADLTTANIAFTIEVASINTRNSDRDNHLRSADFFNAEAHPTITFTSTNIVRDGDDYQVTGDMTIKGVTKPVTFEVEYNGKGKTPDGTEVYGFEAETKINREDFDLTWNAALETGGVLVGKDVKIHVALELNPAA
ncbi:MAG TPA: YceI family protein [Metalysinibacillus jejuensis]|uniref:YceI family protein n=1 Tax=Metalysinibacillus jejuensis TaxID=914327 RepID=A0A921T4W6_9BACL|nr:YceI family protein [Metalysinibacillus jejuensis]HJH10922.1 YceI family protein [Metalysinibacillus jejuensis]